MPLGITPTRIDLGSVRLGEKAKGTTEILIVANSLREERLRILPGSDGPGLAVSLDRKRDRTWVLGATFEARQPGTVRLKVAVGVPRHNEPLAFVPVVASVPAPVSAQPRHLYLGTVYQGRTLEFDVGLKWGYDETEFVSASTSCISCRILPSTDPRGRPTKLHVSLSFGRTLGLVKDYLVVETRNPTWKGYVPIVGFVEESPRS